MKPDDLEELMSKLYAVGKVPAEVGSVVVDHAGFAAYDTHGKLQMAGTPEVLAAIIKMCGDKYGKGSRSEDLSG